MTFWSSQRMTDTTGINGLLPPKSAANYIGVHIQTFRRFMRTKNKKLRIPHYQIAGRYYCRQEDLDTWLESQKK
ncbi:MAG: helix-turn-helix domain-containing protein [Patescibacteria group bacterium]|nr:helix-turn-helix domain-containing protein [Patescibacteria group bacterium]